MIRASDGIPATEKNLKQDEHAINNSPSNNNIPGQIEQIEDLESEIVENQELALVLYNPQINKMESHLSRNCGKVTAGDFYRNVFQKIYACDVEGVENLELFTGYLEGIDNNKIIPLFKNTCVFKLLQLHIKKQDENVRTIRNVLECVNDINSNLELNLLSITKNIFSVCKLLYRSKGVIRAIGGFVTCAFNANNSITMGSEGESSSSDSKKLYSPEEIKYFEGIKSNTLNIEFDKSKHVKKFEKSFNKLFALFPLMYETDIKDLIEMNIIYKQLYDTLDDCLKGLFINLDEFICEFESLTTQSVNKKILKSLKNENRKLIKTERNNHSFNIGDYVFVSNPLSLVRMFGVCMQIYTSLSSSSPVTRSLENANSQNTALLNRNNMNLTINNQSQFMETMNMFFSFNSSFCGALENYISPESIENGPSGILQIEN